MIKEHPIKLLRHVPDDEDLEDNAQIIIYHTLVPILGVFVIVINSIVVYSSGLILKSSHEPKATYLFLGNVAMADLVSAVAIIVGVLYPKENRGQTMCSIQIGLIVSSTLASIYSVGLIAFDRFLYILHGMKYQVWIYPERARILIVLVWLSAAIVGFLPLMGWSSDANNEHVCWFILIAPHGLILLTVTIGALPLFTVIILYTAILFRALKSIVHLETSNQNSTLRVTRGSLNRRINTPSRWKAVKVVVFTFGSIVITWCPYFVASVVYTTCEDETEMCNTLQFLIASPLAMLGFLNSLINPVIYAWWHKGFRSYVLKRIRTYRAQRRLTAEIASVSGGSSGNIKKLCACQSESNASNAD